ncbi:serine hydrolase [Streptomyces sp. SP17BM10]|uniref:serine hydrolase domain-containing protein n=1 Tax=Streptomyces sp. SP17BM10 TaxID=3002530 RepID=UPI002E75BD5D|nr:serine hydrolase domain-containing protein [Streptomyces sp. SP17BM10]MEE1783158.1 serine hydrolase [Streptomyces sp. SP17BM10]
MAIVRTALAAPVLAGLLLAAAPSPALAAGPDDGALQAAFATRAGDPAAGAIARVAVDGRTWRGSDDDPVSGEPVAPNASFRIGSINKTFVAAVLLQLAAEGRIDLDGTVQQYLPGALPDAFRPVTVRQLLNHTSGLPPVVEGPEDAGNDDVIADRFMVESLDEVIQRTLRPTDRPWPGPVFEPGSAQRYDNINYRVAGRIIEQVTGRSFKDEVTARILRPLGLRHTEVTEGAPRLPTPHLAGYLDDSSHTPVDVSEQGGNPESMVSTPADLDRFLRALLDGELLPPQQLRDLLTLPRDAAGQLVPSLAPDDCQFGPDKGRACYSAGLMAIPLQDGTVVWGKTGHDLGYSDGIFATPDLSRRLVYSSGSSSGTPAPALRLAVTVFGPFAH